MKPQKRSTRSKPKTQPHPKKKPVTKTKSKNSQKSHKDQPINEAPSQPVLEILNEPDYKVEKEGNKYSVSIHKKYTIECQSDLGKKIQNFVVLLKKKQMLADFREIRIAGCSFFPTFQFGLAGQDPSHEKCSICQFQYEKLSLEELEKQLVQQKDTDLVVLRCSHIMHLECLREMIGDKEWLKCPVCSSIYGKMIGDQPPGTMNHYTNKLMQCDGYPECGTIIIDYNMHSGSRGPIKFPGTHRSAYLPDNKQGNEVLALLKQAFDRKLIFTIGRSVTTGRDNQIVWNGIHHKTNTSGGSAYFGYPDPTYFQRVKLELAAKGVF